MRRGDQPIPRQSGIQCGEIEQADPHAAERDRHGGRLLAARQFQSRPGAAQGGDQLAGADPVEQQDRRHVQRMLQGHARCHRAVEIAVEILRRIAADAHAPVIDPAVQQHDLFVEGHAVDEWLERRSGRAPSPGEVKRAVDAADPGADGEGAILDHQDGDFPAIAHSGDGLRRQPFGLELDGRREGAADCHAVTPPEP